MSTWKGEWLDSGDGTSQISYYVDDLVNYRNIVFICTADVPLGSVAPEFDMGNWDEYVSGALGTSGTSGTSGSGTSGSSGFGVPTGGTSGQVLSKIDGTDYNTQWIDVVGGGGSTFPYTGTAGITGTLAVDGKSIMGFNGNSVAANYTSAEGGGIPLAQIDIPNNGYSNIKWNDVHYGATNTTTSLTTFITSGDKTSDFTTPETATTFSINSSPVSPVLYSMPTITNVTYDGGNDETTITFNPPLESVYDLYSFTIASGIGSHAEGHNTNASGTGSHAEGEDTAASGNYSHSEGGESKAFGEYSHAEGSSTAFGYSSHSEGGGETGTNGAFFVDNIDQGEFQINSSFGDVTYIFTQGRYVTINDLDGDGNYDNVSVEVLESTFNGTNTVVTLVFGEINTTSGALIIAVSDHQAGNTLFGGEYQHAESESTALGYGSHAEGEDTASLGNYSHSEGLNSRALGTGSHSEGENTFSVGDKSHSEGVNTKSKGVGSHAEGRNTISNGEGSHAEGYESVSTGDYSHAEGQLTTATGNFSHTEGLGTIASGEYQHVQGMYNESDSTPGAFIIGNGSDGDNRSNLMFASDSLIIINGNLWVNLKLNVYGGLNAQDLPTSSTGLGVGDVWVDTTAGNVLKIVL
jgi:hypothetical protein